MSEIFPCPTGPSIGIMNIVGHKVEAKAVSIFGSPMFILVVGWLESDKLSLPRDSQILGGDVGTWKSHISPWLPLSALGRPDSSFL